MKIYNACITALSATCLLSPAIMAFTSSNPRTMSSTTAINSNTQLAAGFSIIEDWSINTDGGVTGIITKSKNAGFGNGETITTSKLVTPINRILDGTTVETLSGSKYQLGTKQGTRFQSSKGKVPANINSFPTLDNWRLEKGAITGTVRNSSSPKLVNGKEITTGTLRSTGGVKDDAIVMNLSGTRYKLGKKFAEKSRLESIFANVGFGNDEKKKAIEEAVAMVVAEEAVKTKKKRPAAFASVGRGLTKGVGRDATEKTVAGTIAKPAEKQSIFATIGFGNGKKVKEDTVTMDATKPTAKVPEKKKPAPFASVGRDTKDSVAAAVAELAEKQSIFATIGFGTDKKTKEETVARDVFKTAAKAPEKKKPAPLASVGRGITKGDTKDSVAVAEPAEKQSIFAAIGFGTDKKTKENGRGLTKGIRRDSKEESVAAAEPAAKAPEKKKPAPFASVGRGLTKGVGRDTKQKTVAAAEPAEKSPQKTNSSPFASLGRSRTKDITRDTPQKVDEVPVLTNWKLNRNNDCLTGTISNSPYENERDGKVVKTVEIATNMAFVEEGFTILTVDGRKYKLGMLKGSKKKENNDETADFSTFTLVDWEVSDNLTLTGTVQDSENDDTPNGSVVTSQPIISDADFIQEGFTVVARDGMMYKLGSAPKGNIWSFFPNC